mmetsp:Transcript_39973/g.61172  ORF Transcript_39973/g.61172 Transcript_39973/m.61172 type:complete len:85 (+) Transcript_39973:103-357(+)
MKLKEEIFNLKIENGTLNEVNMVLKEQIKAFRERITELERESAVQFKENFALNGELDYENAKNKKLQDKNQELAAGSRIGDRWT